MDPLAEKYPSTEIKCEPGIEDKMDSSAVTEGDPGELFCDFEAVSDLIKKEDDDIKFKDEWDHAKICDAAIFGKGRESCIQIVEGEV